MIVSKKFFRYNTINILLFIGDVKMKIKVNSNMSFEDIKKYLYPIEQYGNEKINNNMYDDWNELEHTTKWLEKILKSIKKNNGDILDIYYLEDKGNIIGVIFSLSGNDNLKKFLHQNNIVLKNEKVAQLSCFHIVKSYRGIGQKWLVNEVLNDLQEQGFKKIYLKSSHNKALRLYDKIGTRIGNYIGISDHELYQRYGYIYRIDL